MGKLRPLFILTFLCLFLSTAAHAAYLVEWAGDRFMLGPNDGLSQMMPFKAMLYEQYTSGEFFYSPFFGLGSGTYSGLSYYFSTSIFFALTINFFFIFELLGVITEPDILFWAHAAVFINIVKLTLVLIVSYLVFRYMKFQPVPAFLGASIYGLSSMYFRHAVYWEFFADAYLWLPLLIFGIEKILREQRPGWFIAAVAIAMIDSFYFAYINLLLAGIYILFRLFLPLAAIEIKRGKAVILFLISGLFGAGISAVSFIPAVHAFLHNHRPDYVHDIEWIRFHDNILFTSSYVILPAAFIGLAFALPLYRDRRFRFFVSVSLACVLLHYSPQVASVFNGFSAPQYRWEFFLSFVSGGAVAAGVSNLALLKIKDISKAGVLALIVYGLFALGDERLEIHPLLIGSIALISVFILMLYTVAVKRKSKIGEAAVALFMALLFTAAAYQFIVAVAREGVTIQFPLFLGVLGSALLMFILLVRAVEKDSKSWEAVVFIVITLLVLANGFQYVNLIKGGKTERVTEEYMTGRNYDDPEINRLLEQIEERETFPFYRIDWMEGRRNNTPIVEGFFGLSAYSSILNEELLFFYLHELEIDMARESVSRYATLGKRANLHSLLLGNYVILPHGDENVPAGFERVLESENFIVYENQWSLPFIRPATAAYSEESLAGEPVLRREHAMLSGVVLKNPDEQGVLPPVPEELEFEAAGVEATYENGLLEVTGENGGIDVQLIDTVPAESDLYISFNLVNLAESEGFALTVNSYRTLRKPNDSIYKTFVDDLTIRVPADDIIRIRVPEGTYKLSELAVYEESYEVLRTEAAEAKGSNRFEWSGSRIKAEYLNATDDQFIVLPVPYEVGWTAKINDEKVEVLEANYAFIALPASPGMNEIELTYRPPHFWKSLLLSLLSLLGAALYLFMRRKI
ncbi:YfhO family protein [Planomicrobium okeanokoites]|uniref:YfhO family protein n=1 Tax=Planomicrobium okeanokoites TaxID=244 RepID=UPI003562BF28